MTRDLDELTRKIEERRSALIRRGVIKPVVQTSSAEMRTHHGRPGGRLLEVVLGLALVAASVMAIVAAVVAVETLLTWMDASDRKIGKAIYPIAMATMLALAPVWKALLKYYRYDPGTLRPIKPEEPNDGQSN